MSISTVYAPVSYTGDDTTDEFPVSWGINVSSEIVVTETIISTGVETIKTLTTHYTVTGTGPVTITAVTPPASTVRWTIGRNVPSTQLVDYVENDSFPAATHEAALDKLTMLSQEHDQAFLRALRQPNGDTADIDYLPPKITRASKYLGFDGDGDPVALAAPTDSTAVSVFAATLLDDADAAAMFVTLGAVVADWTPAVGGNATYSAQSGKIISLGKCRFFTGTLGITTLGTGSTNTISGLPDAATTQDFAVLVGETSSLAVSPVSFNPTIQAVSASISLFGRTAGATGTTLLAALGNGANITVTGFYIVA